MIVLENEGFRVEINPFGAELTSFRSKTTGTEYVWGGDPAAWKRHAPVLFPIVGRLKDKTYTVDGASFEYTPGSTSFVIPYPTLPNHFPILNFSYSSAATDCTVASFAVVGVVSAVTYVRVTVPEASFIATGLYSFLLSTITTPL